MSPFVAGGESYEEEVENYPSLFADFVNVEVPIVYTVFKLHLSLHMSLNLPDGHRNHRCVFISPSCLASRFSLALADAPNYHSSIHAFRNHVHIHAIDERFCSAGCAPAPAAARYRIHVCAPALLLTLTGVPSVRTGTRYLFFRCAPASTVA